MTDVLYLYGFVPADAPVPPDTLRGIDGGAVERVPVGELGAIVSGVAGDDYTAARIEAGLEDLAWVAERGLAHERVVAWFVDAAEILPAPLFTLYSSRAALDSALSARAAELVAELRRLAGRREWDLKVSCRRDQLEQHAGEVSEEVRSLEREIAEAAPGRRFLLERKRAEVVKRELSAAAHRVAEQLLAQLRPLADEVAPLAPPRDAAELPVLLAAALLLRREQEDAVRRVVAERGESLGPLGFTVTVTGPWAPYRFVEPAPSGV